MKRRNFLRALLFGGIFLLFGKKADAEKNPDMHLRKAMFWKKID
jgi:hypothetical protein